MTQKFRIKNLKLETQNGQYGPYRQFVFADEISGLWVYANERKGFTDNFRVGYEFEVHQDYISKNTSRTSQKPYFSIKWPKPDQAPKSGSDAEILRKLDQILAILNDSYGEPPMPEGLPTEEPPPHEDEDSPYPR